MSGGQRKCLTHKSRAFNIMLCAALPNQSPFLSTPVHVLYTQLQAPLPTGPAYLYRRSCLSVKGEPLQKGTRRCKLAYLDTYLFPHLGRGFLQVAVHQVFAKLISNTRENTYACYRNAANIWMGLIHSSFLSGDTQFGPLSHYFAPPGPRTPSVQDVYMRLKYMIMRHMCGIGSHKPFGFVIGNTPETQCGSCTV